MKRVAIVTDAWAPQTNGVVTTLEAVIRHLPSLGWEAVVVHPGLFRTVPLPGYREIGVALDPWRVGSILRELNADTVHIATEGPLGLCARNWLVKSGKSFTTSLHTKFPEYVNERTRLPVSVGYRFLRRFHSAADRTLCTTPTHKGELEAAGLSNLVVWGRGVDTRLFKPLPSPPQRERLRLVYVGRVAVEKNIEAFLELNIDADKRVVGDGPQRPALQKRFPEAEWLGYRKGAALAEEYAHGDVFVFPSKTDTFGLVMLEAMACGTPVAAYPVTGPVDVIRQGVNGFMHHDLGVAVREAARVDRNSCRAFACHQDWQMIARTFVENLVDIDGKGVLARPLCEAA